MSTLAIDTYRLLTALKGTGKSANYSAEEIAQAIHLAQEGNDLLTRREFVEHITGLESRVDAKFGAIEARFDAMETKFDAMETKFDAKCNGLEARFDAKLEALRADVKSGQMQSLMWLSGIVLASNGAVIALLARLTHVI